MYVGIPIGETLSSCLYVVVVVIVNEISVLLMAMKYIIFFCKN